MIIYRKAMSEGYKTISVRFSTYEKLKNLSKKTGKSFSKILDELIDGVSETKGFDESVIRKIVREEVAKALDEIKVMLHNMVEKS